MLTALVDAVNGSATPMQRAQHLILFERLLPDFVEYLGHDSARVSDAEWVQFLRELFLGWGWRGGVASQLTTSHGAPAVAIDMATTPAAGLTEIDEDGLRQLRDVCTRLILRLFSPTQPAYYRVVVATKLLTLEAAAKRADTALRVAAADAVAVITDARATGHGRPVEAVSERVLHKPAATTPDAVRPAEAEEPELTAAIDTAAAGAGVPGGDGVAAALDVAVKRMRSDPVEVSSDVLTHFVPPAEGAARPVPARIGGVANLYSVDVIPRAIRGSLTEADFIATELWVGSLPRDPRDATKFLVTQGLVASGGRVGYRHVMPYATMVAPAAGAVAGTVPSSTAQPPPRLNTPFDPAKALPTAYAIRVAEERAAKPISAADTLVPFAGRGPTSVGGGAAITPPLIVAPASVPGDGAALPQLVLTSEVVSVPFQHSASKAMVEWESAFPSGSGTLADVLRFFFRDTPDWVITKRIDGHCFVVPDEQMSAAAAGEMTVQLYKDDDTEVAVPYEAPQYYTLHPACLAALTRPSDAPLAPPPPPAPMTAPVMSEYSFELPRAHALAFELHLLVQELNYIESSSADLLRLAFGSPVPFGHQAAGADADPAEPEREAIKGTSCGVVDIRAAGVGADVDSMSRLRRQLLQTKSPIAAAAGKLLHQEGVKRTRLIERFLAVLREWFDTIDVAESGVITLDAVAAAMCDYVAPAPVCGPRDSVNHWRPACAAFQTAALEAHNRGQNLAEFASPTAWLTTYDTPREASSESWRQYVIRMLRARVAADAAEANTGHADLVPAVSVVPVPATTSAVGARRVREAAAAAGAPGERMRVAVGPLDMEAIFCAAHALRQAGTLVYDASGPAAPPTLGGFNVWLPSMRPEAASDFAAEQGAVVQRAQARFRAASERAAAAAAAATAGGDPAAAPSEKAAAAKPAGKGAKSPAPTKKPAAKGAKASAAPVFNEVHDLAYLTHGMLRNTVEAAPEWHAPIDFRELVSVIMPVKGSRLANCAAAVVEQRHAPQSADAEQEHAAAPVPPLVQADLVKFATLWRDSVTLLTGWAPTELERRVDAAGHQGNFQRLSARRAKKLADERRETEDNLLRILPASVGGLAAAPKPAGKAAAKPAAKKPAGKPAGAATAPAGGLAPTNPYGNISGLPPGPLPVLTFEQRMDMRLRCGALRTSRSKELVLTACANERRLAAERVAFQCGTLVALWVGKVGADGAEIPAITSAHNLPPDQLLRAVRACCDASNSETDAVEHVVAFLRGFCCDGVAQPGAAAHAFSLVSRLGFLAAETVRALCTPVPIAPLDNLHATPRYLPALAQFLQRLDMSGINPCHFLSQPELLHRIYADVGACPLSTSSFPSEAMLAAMPNGATIHHRGYLTGGRVYRDFATAPRRPPTATGHWGAAAHTMRLITNIPAQSDVMYRLHFEGYNFGVGAAVSTVVVGYAGRELDEVDVLEWHGWPADWDRSTVLHLAPGVAALQQRVSPDTNTVEFVLQSPSFIQVGISVSAWLVTPRGNGAGFALTGRFVHDDPVTGAVVG